MTSSFRKAQVRNYRKNHPWAKKLPKQMTGRKVSLSADALNKVDLSLIDSHILEQYNEMWDRIEGDGSWAIVYDETRKGEWLFELAENGWVDHVCSECKFTVNTDFHVGLGKEYNRCPRCGADMRKEHGVRFEDDRIVVY